MLKALAISFGAFWSDPLKFVSDPTNTVIEYQTKKMAAEGKTEAEIKVVLTDIGLLEGAGPVKVVIDNVAKAAEFTLKNLPSILLAVAVFMAGWVILKMSRAVK